MQSIKHNIRFITLIIILLFPALNSLSAPVSISLYNSRQVQSVVISAYSGALTISSDNGTGYVIADGQAIYATLRDGMIRLCDEHGRSASFERVSVQGADSSAIVRLRPTSPQLEARNYEGTVIMSADVDKIRIINRIEEDMYIAGVVEAEVGQGRTGEFYKAKAIICRTYLYGNTGKHPNEDFHLCDEVHCQVYRGQCRNRVIQSAVTDTKNIIIVDLKDSKPILAPYHSNCGGETESAQNVWRSNVPYLTPVIDPYCTSSPNARWERTVSLNDWIAYLVKNGFKPNPNVVTDFSFQQKHRTLNYKVNDFTIPVRTIRADWQFKSTFFSISVEEGNLIFRGRGYGHGVGLCQEGAIEMGRRGFKYDEIIYFYYKNTKLTVND